MATPIGNMGDITIRALDIFVKADVVACEDTRVTGKLLSHYGIKKTLLKYNDHTSENERSAIIKRLERGEMIALVSDAGMPMISDPGYKLVRKCVERGIYTTSLPGASASLAGLQLSGLPSDQFSFIGFLPAKSGARKTTLKKWESAEATLVAYETGPRLLASLNDILTVMGERQVCVARELTKLHEDVRRGNVSELIAYYKAESTPKGEIVVVVGQGHEKEWSDAEIKTELKKALETMSTKDAAAHISKVTDRSRKELYDLAVEISE